jgi:hypothetical protein
LDADLNVYLMEVNLSPNLAPPEPQYSHHRQGYEEVVTNTLNVIGLGENPWRLGSFGGDDLQFRLAELEHQSKGVLRRVFPPGRFLEDEENQQLSVENQRMLNWYKTKCEEDDSWC